MTLDDQPIAPPDEVKDLISSIMLDWGEVPPDMLVPAGDGEYDPSLYEDKENDSDAWKGTYHERGHTSTTSGILPASTTARTGACCARSTSSPATRRYVAEVIAKHQGLVKHLRRTFEAMRDESKLLKRQPQGDDVDIDALVEALADARDGREMSEQLFMQRHRADRNLAVMFMVDMSGSTKGWINDAERESLVMLCESLETLGDRYAIYGFSGTTRKRCEIYRIKTFDQAYDAERQGAHRRHRAAGIHPHGGRHPPPGQTAERGRGQDQAADHPLRWQARRLFRQLSRPIRHRGYAAGPVRSPPQRYPPLLHHHRSRRQGLPAAHVRPRQLGGDRRGAQAAPESGRHLPAADNVNKALIVMIIYNENAVKIELFLTCFGTEVLKVNDHQVSLKNNFYGNETIHEFEMHGQNTTISLYPVTVSKSTYYRITKR